MKGEKFFNVSVVVVGNISNAVEIQDTNYPV